MKYKYVIACDICLEAELEAPSSTDKLDELIDKNEWAIEGTYYIDHDGKWVTSYQILCPECFATRQTE